ncbi:MAG TPA: hypothetical protein ENH84_03130, partial [Phycisphaerae bacterium]|nr:hypothetical protein [Phycisphaerae bacterium]
MRPKRSKTNQWLIIATMVTTAAAMPGMALAEELVALDATNNDLYRVDTDHMGSPVLLGNISVGTDLSGIVAAGTDRLYTFDRDANSIITVSALDASVLSVVTLDRDSLVRPRGFDASPDGVLYGVFGGMELRTVAPDTGQTTLVTNISGAGASMIEGLAFSPDGTPFLVGAGAGYRSDTLYTLDVQTGALSLVGSLNVPDIDCLTYGLDGYLYGTDSLGGRQADLYRIDPATAQVSIVGNTAVYEVNGIASLSESVTLVE